MQTNKRALAVLKRNAARLLREAQDTSSAEERTRRYRELADVVVAIRESFSLPTGEPDWRGKSYAYRQAMAEVYSDAHVSPDDLITVQQAIRYHVSNLLRARLDEETLLHIGLRPESARDRAREVRQARSAIIESARAANGTVSAVKAVHGAAALLRRVDPGDVAALPPAERKDLLHALKIAADEIAGLQAHIRSARG